MARFNGVGTGFLGWRHGADGGSTATLWFTIVYMPVIPLRRYQLRNLTDFEAERAPTGPELAGALLGGLAWTESIEVIARIPLAWMEILATYLRCYALIPLLCYWPVLVIRPVLEAIEQRGVEVPQGVLTALAAFFLANAVIVLLRAVRRGRGYPGPRAGTGT